MTAIKWVVVFHRDYEDQDNFQEIIERADELGQLNIPIKLVITENETGSGERVVNLLVPQKHFIESAKKIFGWA